MVLAACLAFAATVEFIQLFAPTRTCWFGCTGSRIGAIIGMTAWLAFGQWIIVKFIWP